MEHLGFWLAVALVAVAAVWLTKAGAAMSGSDGLKQFGASL